MITRTIVCILVSLWLAGPASAQAPRGADWDEDRRRAAARDDREDRDEESRLAFRGGLGFTADPSTFLMAFELPYSLTCDFTIGPLLQIGVDSHETLVAPTLNARYFLNLGQRDSRNDFLRELAPFVQGGLGLVHLDRDHKFRDRDDTAFLLNMGFGVDFPLTEKLSVGSHMMFNVVPGDVLDENFFFSWQMFTAQIRF